ncbi:CTTNBP2 N-terminal-like protein [Alosa pseudoharengus]|uniref:CTTNBP2 N-terminal-like protein n=1 Tax=Alosa pseudoharengus TaxID=34774 RepID=UPI003F8CDBC1
MALQRDSEVVAGTVTDGDDGGGIPNPLAVLKLLMAHCKRMQDKMRAQLAAAEIRHRRVISDLEEEKRRHAQDMAQGDDVTYMLEKEREKLLQQLECEQARQQQLQQECERAVTQAQEEAERASELQRRLQEESSSAQSLQGALQEQQSRVHIMEAAAEKQLDELHAERDQLQAKLRREEQRSKELQEQLEALRKELGERERVKEKGEKERENKKERENGGKEKERGGVKLTPVKTTPSSPSSSSGQTETDGKSPLATKAPPPTRLNGHAPQSPAPHDSGAEAESVSGDSSSACVVGVVSGGRPLSPAVATPLQSPTPTSPASSSLSSSPCSSPILSKRGPHTHTHTHTPPYPPVFQASVNQRFHAARHKFQSQAEQDHHTHTHTHTLSPRDLSPTTTPTPPPATPADNSAAKQLARNTVTQVLSRFTSQQGGAKMAPLSSSPFGTDYRTLASSPSSSSSSSPTCRSPGPLSPGVRSPSMPRCEKGHPPPVPPKRPGASQSPSSPGPSRSSHFPELSGSCGLTSAQEGAKELDLVVSSSS